MRGDLIVAVGSAKEIESWRRPSTRVVNGRGRTLMPGFNDSHVHLLGAGERLDKIDLKEVASLDEVVRLIGERARSTPEGAVDPRRGVGRPALEPAAAPLGRADRRGDARHPVFLHRYDGHMALANSLALRLAGITRGDPRPARRRHRPRRDRASRPAC